MTSLVHLASRLYGTPLLIARAKLDTILAVLGPRIGLASVETASIGLVLPTAAPMASDPVPTMPGIAVIPIHGTLVRRALGLDAMSGLTSYARIAADLDAALTNPDVAGILLDIDSPGGEAGGVFELAEQIRAASAIKPIWAHAGDSAFSAAYALASAAQRVSLAQTGGVGSIGVIALHIDQSVRNAQNGLSVTALYAGAHKNDATPHAPLTPQATEALQTEIDRLYALFVDHVAAMRGLDADAVRATEAALFFGEDAVTAGLADAVAPFDAVLADFATALGRSSVSPKPPASPARLALPPPTETSMTLPTEAAPVPSTPPAAPAPPAPAAVVPTVAPVALPTPAASTAPPSADAQSEAVAIAELCLLAGCPERTGEFLAARLSAAQVRQVLLQARADQVEIASHLTVTGTPGATTAANAATTANPVLDAVRRRIAVTHPQGA